MSHRHVRSARAFPEQRRAIGQPPAVEVPRAGPSRRTRNLRNPQTDEDLAYRLAVEEVRALETREQDRALALRLHDEGDRRHSNLLRIVRRRRLNGAPGPQRLPANLFPARTADGNGQAVATARLIRGDHEHHDAVPHPLDRIRMLLGLAHDAQSSTPRLPKRVHFEEPAPDSLRLTGHECVSCMDPIRGVEVRAPCDHYYDKECILALFTAALRDETLFPPRCCRQRIPVTLVQPHLSPEVLSQFKSKAKELRVEKRVYCAKPSCSRFLGAQYEGVLPALLAPNLKCPAPGCGTYTCSWCKNETKRGEKHHCEENSADRRVLALGQEAGWVRCPGCEAMIELTMGCHHMTCRCKAEFCFLCRARWKTCQCVQWEERRLVAAAEERADGQIRLERGRRAHIRRRPPPRLRLADQVEPIRIAEIPAVPPREADDVVDVPRAAPETPPPQDLTLDATIHHAFEELVAIYLGSTAPRGRNPLGDAQPAPTRDSIISNPFDDTHRVSVALGGDMDSLAVEIDAGSSSVAPLRWNKQPEDERERRHALTLHWVERLRDNHACDHDRWTFHRGEGLCAVCEEHIPVCYFRCNSCEMQICRKCRWNRT